VKKQHEGRNGFFFHRVRRMWGHSVGKHFTQKQKTWKRTHRLYGGDGDQKEGKKGGRRWAGATRWGRPGKIVPEIKNYFERRIPEKGVDGGGGGIGS